MEIDRFILDTIYTAMQWPAFRDSPFAPWREPVTPDCLDRVCEHTSCTRREAFCRFEAWYLHSVVRS